MPETENQTDTTVTQQKETPPQTRDNARQLWSFVVFLIFVMLLALANAAAVYHVQAVYFVYAFTIGALGSLFFTLKD